MKRKKLSDALRKERKRAGPLGPMMDKHVSKGTKNRATHPENPTVLSATGTRKRINFKMRKAAARKTGMGGGRKGGKVNPRAWKGRK